MRESYVRCGHNRRLIMWSTLREALRRHADRLHDRAGRPRRHPARGSDGRRDGDGVDLRRRRRLLGRAPRRRRGRHRRPDRVDAHHHLHGRDGAVDRRDGARGAADRRARSGRRGARGRAVDPARASASPPRSRWSARAERRGAAAPDGRVATSRSRTGSGFTRIMLGGNATVLLLFLLNAVFRGAGDAAIAMRVLVLGNLLNIVLGPCFIFGLGPFPGDGRRRRGGGHQHRPRHRRALPGRHARSAAAAACRSGLRHLRLDFATMSAVLRLSGLGTFQILIGTASYIGLVRILSVFGSAALAGYTIGIRVIIFALLPAFGISNAAATMVGQNLGAGRPDRAERRGVDGGALQHDLPRRRRRRLPASGRRSSPASSRPIRWFSRTPIACLRIVSLGFVFYAAGMVLTQSFNGAGDTWTPTYINLFVFWLFEIPLAWFLATRGRLRRPRRLHRARPSPTRRWRSSARSCSGEGRGKRARCTDGRALVRHEAREPAHLTSSEAPRLSRRRRDRQRTVHGSMNSTRVPSGSNTFNCQRLLTPMFGVARWLRSPGFVRARTVSSACWMSCDQQRDVVRRSELPPVWRRVGIEHVFEVVGPVGHAHVDPAGRALRAVRRATFPRNRSASL